MKNDRNPTRVYLVKDSTSGAERLVRASVMTVAIRHAAREQFTAHKATQDELLRLISAGVRVELAAEQAPEPADPVDDAPQLP